MVGILRRPYPLNNTPVGSATERWPQVLANTHDNCGQTTQLTALSMVEHSLESTALIADQPWFQNPHASRFLAYTGPFDGPEPYPVQPPARLWRHDTMPHRPVPGVHGQLLLRAG